MGKEKKKMIEKLGKEIFIDNVSVSLLFSLSLRLNCIVREEGGSELNCKPLKVQLRLFLQVILLLW